MAPINLLQLILLLYGYNKSTRSVIVLDCNHSNITHWINTNIKIVEIIFDSKVNLNSIVNTIKKKLKKSEQINILMNYECDLAKDILELVINILNLR